MRRGTAVMQCARSQSGVHAHAAPSLTARLTPPCLPCLLQHALACVNDAGHTSSLCACAAGTAGTVQRHQRSGRAGVLRRGLRRRVQQAHQQRHPVLLSLLARDPVRNQLRRPLHIQLPINTGLRSVIQCTQGVLIRKSNVQGMVDDSQAHLAIRCVCLLCVQVCQSPLPSLSGPCAVAKALLPSRPCQSQATTPIQIACRCRAATEPYPALSPAKPAHRTARQPRSGVCGRMQTRATAAARRRGLLRPHTASTATSRAITSPADRWYWIVRAAQRPRSEPPSHRRRCTLP